MRGFDYVKHDQWKQKVSAGAKGPQYHPGAANRDELQQWQAKP